MKTTFFQRHALAILCIVAFCVPFSLRGGRMALLEMKNDVKDWLPSSFAETRVLEWFGDHFANERFVVLTWPGCSTDDQRYRMMVKRLENQVVPANEVALMPTEEQAANDPELRRLRAQLKTRQMADRLGLFFTGDYHQNWGGRDEKWLRGDGDSWYYITPDGTLYRWNSGNHVLSALQAVVNRLRNVPVEGTKIAHLDDEATGSPRDYYRDPRRLTARYFSSVVTGPLVVEQLANPHGPLWPYGKVPEDDKPRLARYEALERLSGNLFGPALHEDFAWTAAALADRLPEEKLAELPTNWQQTFDEYVGHVVQEEFNGNHQQLVQATFPQRQEHWEALFARLGVEPPAQQTCIVVTLSEAAKRDMRRVIGRPLLGRPRGQLLALASECGISTDGPHAELKLGGPPVDNIAIDEEGSITLVRLVGFCIALGLGLSLVCLRSIALTTLVFLIGGLSAVLSLSLVYWTGSTLDAVLMSMPSLVYVLGISGAVHIVNYYRDAVDEHGRHGATGRAVRMGFVPCTLAALTTAVGLGSLYASNLIPIQKFGLFSALGVMATLILLFTLLPAALELWPPRHVPRRSDAEETSEVSSLVTTFWSAMGRWIIRHHRLVAASCMLLMIGIGWGIQKINTSVQLLKLFDPDAKIIRDYAWLEGNIGQLVPMEIIVRITPEMLRPSTTELANQQAVDPEDRFKLTMLQRMELSRRLQNAIQREFGPEGRGIVGPGMSAATFGPDFPEGPQGSAADRTRDVINVKLEDSHQALIDTDYLRIDHDPAYAGSELWRISLRVGALNDVDYGEFVHDLKDVVEPILRAYASREQVLRSIVSVRESQPDKRDLGFLQARVAVLGAADPLQAPAADGHGVSVSSTRISRMNTSVADLWKRNHGTSPSRIDQTTLFQTTLADLLRKAGFEGRYAVDWVDPKTMPLSADELKTGLKDYDCVILVADDPQYDPEIVKAHAKAFVDARSHHFVAGVDPTAAERGDHIHALYTGVVPVVYKAQRTLLSSLVQSIGWAFVLIAVVMMLLLRTGNLTPLNVLNVRGGLVSMLPNIFPVALIFGAMGYMGVAVDIGSMMTASVALGIAVDDTIHFLSWFRSGIRAGLDRFTAIEQAYERCASAMVTTTIIGGLGLSVFMFSTFTPTQRFGLLMLTLLSAALLGDLIFLPALLASRWGRYFLPRDRAELREDDELLTPPYLAADVQPAHTGFAEQRTVTPAPHMLRDTSRLHVRTDPPHVRE